MDYFEHIKVELLASNRILSFDVRFWNRRSELGLEPTTATERALILIQTENHEFLKAIKTSVKDKNLRAAGSLLRSLLESTANAYWLTSDTTGKRVNRYLAVIENYDNYLESIKADEAPRISSDTSNWTSSSAEDRINAFSPQAGLVWDYCSVFTHPSPTYVSLERGLERVLDYVIGQANTYAITARYCLLNNSDVFNSNEAKFLNKKTQAIIRERSPSTFGIR